VQHATLLCGRRHREFVEIADRGTEDIYEGNDTPRARRTLPLNLHQKAAGLLDRVSAATKPMDLRVPNSNRLEKLTGDRAGQWSVRINDKYRICFDWVDGQAANVEIVDYH
jgi:proteic killer suppression protein